ncbi:MAG: ZPR1 zinc finger domain-containing protein [Candidatus Aenigmatarchaeota archaeon]
MELSICPICKKQSLFFSSLVEEIPYFGKVLILNMKCENCKFKHSDVFNAEIKKPSSYRIKIENEKDLNAKVVRSSSSTLILPELGVKIEPGSHAQGFITNVEGVLERIENVLKSQLDTQKGNKLERINKLLEKIERMKEGREKFTLIIKDPFGNSGIVSEKAKKRKLSKGELKNLKTGAIVLDLMK